MPRNDARLTVWTIGHSTRPIDDFLAALAAHDIETLVDVRRFPGSRRHPQFNHAQLAAALDEHGIEYAHAVELGGRLSGEPGEGRFACIRTAAFRSYAARMGTDAWQAVLAQALAEPAPCFMCAETSWTKCHRRLIAELLVARGESVVHLIRPGEREAHRISNDVDVCEGRLYLCGELVA